MNIWWIFGHFLVLLCLFESINGGSEKSFRERARKFCGLVRKCKQREVKNYDYGQLMKISDIAGIQPINYLVRMPFYVMASNDVHILFSETEMVYWNRDAVYEIVVGGANNRTIIRRKRQDMELSVTNTYNVLRKDEPVKLLIEISTAGIIKVFIEHQSEPLAVAKDENPLDIKYFSFASKDNSLAKFFYDCEGENVYGEEDYKQLCQYAEALEIEYTTFYKITDIPGIRSKGFLLNFPFFVQAERDTRILLTTGPKADRNDAEYNFLIGGWDNTRSVIRRQQGARNIADIPNASFLSKNKFIQFVIQITTIGDIRLFRKDGLEPFKLITEAFDQNVIPIEYISFGSWNTNLVKFYFNCSFSVATPDITIATGNLLLPDNIPPSITLSNLLITKCNYYTIAEYNYQRFIKISSIKNSTPGGFILRIVLYIQGDHAHILLTTSDRPNYEHDFAYELVIGGWDKNRVLFRRKKNGVNEAEAYAPNVISNERPTKLLLEMRNSGIIQLYSQSMRSKPIISVNEENPLPIQYISFVGLESPRSQFFFNCSHIKY